MSQFNLTKQEIQNCVKDLGKAINNSSFKSKKPPIVLTVMKGALYFAADLTREFDFLHKLETVEISSYRDNSQSRLTWKKMWQTSLFNRDVIIIEDIVDTGETMRQILLKIHQEQPSSIQLVSLLERENQSAVKVDHKGFIVPEGAFVAGYGMDDRGLNRHIEDIFTLNQ